MLFRFHILCSHVAKGWHFQTRQLKAILNELFKQQCGELRGRSAVNTSVVKRLGYISNCDFNGHFLFSVSAPCTLSTYICYFNDYSKCLL